MALAKAERLVHGVPYFAGRYRKLRIAKVVLQHMRLLAGHGGVLLGHGLRRDAEPVKLTFVPVLKRLIAFGVAVDTV